MENMRLCQAGERIEVAHIINAAAAKYRGVIPDDCWHDPYMSEAELDAEVRAGVVFHGYVDGGRLLGVMGLQHVDDVRLIRHAYVRPEAQGRGIGGKLLRHLLDGDGGKVLVGTWTAASWAIGFYRRHGFTMVPHDCIESLLRRYWDVSNRQVESSVVLTGPGSGEGGECRS